MSGIKGLAMNNTGSNNVGSNNVGSDNTASNNVVSRAAKAKPAKASIARTLIIIGLLLGAVFAGFPILWMVASSFKSNKEIFAYPPHLITESFSINAYKVVLTNPEKLRFFFNSYLVSI